MSTLKFKSKISVPGIECTGDVNTDSLTVNNKANIREIDVDDITIANQVSTNQISQKDATQSITISSTSSAPAKINYLQSQLINIANKYNLITDDTSLVAEDIQTKEQISIIPR